MFERFTDTARRTVVLAQEEARMLNHNYVGPEHLLLALTGDRSFAGQTLTSHGVTTGEARQHVAGIIGEGSIRYHGHLAFTPAAKEILVAALRIALDSGISYIGSEHLLLALLADDKSASALAIEKCGVSCETLRETLTDLMTAPGTPEPIPAPLFVLSA
jgi:ATP-dependent Clp protease ATP-binding subunit ClpC